MMTFTEQFRRRVTEVVVIVVSILLAFALDAWWDEYREAREMGVTRNALVTEFAEIESELAFSVSRNERVIAAADTLLESLNGRNGAVQVHAGTVGSLLLTPTTDPRSGTLTALISSGRLDQLDDLRLQALLASWPAVLEDVREEELAAKTFVHEQLTPYLGAVVDDLAPVFAWRIAEGRGTGSVPEGLRQTLVELPADRQLINFIETRRYLASYVLVNYVLLEEAAGEARETLQR